MIKIEPYTEEFEEIYWSIVNQKVDSDTKDYIVSSSVRFIPKEFWGKEEPSFKNLVLASFKNLQEAQKYMSLPSNYQTMQDNCYVHNTEKKKLNDYYQRLVDAYKDVANSIEKGYSMRVRIVKNSGLTVCPYCNRDYINCRGESASGAQLDHFFEKLDYPVFAVCLYNLVPVCGNCNRIKNDQKVEFASPFDETIDWEKDITFGYEPNISSNAKITIGCRRKDIQNNIEKMRIENAYQIHDIEVEELLEKKKIYVKTQREEFQKVLYGVKVSEQEMKLAIFGPKITKEIMRTRPLGKLMSDLHRQLGIY